MIPKSPLVLIVAWVVLLVAGCNSPEQKKPPKPSGPEPEARRQVPKCLEGTVCEYATLVGQGDMPVQTHGLVIGLGNKGSREVPPQIKKDLSEYLLKMNFNSYRHRTAGITPDLVMSDLDTAVVLVGGAIPLGAPVGSRFDVFVSSLPQTATESLDGGMLMPRELRLAVHGRAVSGLRTNEYAMAGGEVFVNPFLDPSKPEELQKAREGRIIGGGKVTKARPIRLQLLRPDYARINLLQRRINERFGMTSPTRVANALNPSVIDLTVPRDYADDYEHFLKLILRLPVRSSSGAAMERDARLLGEQIELPEAPCEEISLVWEAMGRPVLSAIRPLYLSKNPAAAFYALRAGLRLEDDLAIEPLERIAQMAGSPHQILAIQELGRTRQAERVKPGLRKLLDDSSELVRIAAYEALVSQNDTDIITRYKVGEFALDVVACGGAAAIYATQSRHARIVLFGKDIGVTTPVFFCGPEDLVTVNAVQHKDKLTVFRKVYDPRRPGRVSESFVVDADARTLVLTLGRPATVDADGQVQGLGLTYGQVVSTLYWMCKKGDIAAKFVLQQLPEVQKIYQSIPTTGRPDMPGA